MGLKKGQKLPLRSKVFFAVGAGPDSLYTAMVAGFTLIFYNQGLMLRGDLVGLGLLIATIADAVSDPIIGSLSDGWRSRWGRRHPFLFFAPLPLAISIYFLFSPPDLIVEGGNSGTSGQLMMFAWMTVWMIAGRLFLTMQNIPHLSLGAELSNDYCERASIFSLNAIFAGISASIFGFLAWRIFLNGESLREIDNAWVPGQLNPANYQPLVLFAAIMILVSGLLTAWFTKDRIPYLHQSGIKGRSLSLWSTWKDVIGTLKNHSYRWTLIGLFLLLFTTGIGEAVNPLMGVFFWRLSGEQIAWFAVASFVGVMVGSSAAPVAIRHFEKRDVAVFLVATFAFLVPLPVIGRFMDILPANGSSLLLPLLLIQAGLCASCVSGLNVCVMSMLADLADQFELETGLRQEGILYSSRLFFSKLSSSFTYFVGGMLLQHYILFPVGSNPGEVADDVLFRLAVVSGFLAVVGAAFATFAYGRYRLSRADHASVGKQLETKRQRLSKGEASSSSNVPPHIKAEPGLTQV
ncbi:sugar transporter [Pseudomaricurvus alkylphenolicus]|uniref:MFS transporter n=1 Tax=Pseudomaricurvus alkylphenolicus TaxID=1306991 RepID=UPI0014236517|nr:MFS transporter [Pseudomaricurvus alkylphenolicus]NIB42347.1 sugar transporter [Pseudomaricurvus alkylphenolicus]